jgi:hypothetical protein
MCLYVTSKYIGNFSTFLTKKWKQNENTETGKGILWNKNQNRFFFWHKLETKWNGVFRPNRPGNGIFIFLLIWIFNFIVFFIANLVDPVCDHVKTNCQRDPFPTTTLHRVMLKALGNRFFDFLDLLEFLCMI